jgi:hypothetical protein
MENKIDIFLIFFSLYNLFTPLPIYLIVFFSPLKPPYALFLDFYKQARYNHQIKGEYEFKKFIVKNYQQLPGLQFSLLSIGNKHC